MAGHMAGGTDRGKFLKFRSASCRQRHGVRRGLSMLTMSQAVEDDTMTWLANRHPIGK